MTTTGLTKPPFKITILKSGHAAENAVLKSKVRALEDEIRRLRYILIATRLRAETAESLAEHFREQIQPSLPVEVSDSDEGLSDKTEGEQR